MDLVANINLEPYLSFKQTNSTEIPEDIRELGREVVRSFHQTGIITLRDPRCREEQNQGFIDMLEQYYESASAKLYNGEQVAEVHPELGYQIGATPEFIEQARDHCTRMSEYSEENRPLSLCPPQKDAKWRYFWRIGQFGENRGRFELENIVPEGFPQWTENMNSWGETMVNAIFAVVELLEIGFGLPQGKLTNMMLHAPHLLAPTGSDLNKYKLGTIFAGYHYDLNFITIHGKSRFPGLFAWLRDGTRFRVQVPDGCLLLQAAKMLEYVTGGYITAGFHEVLYSEQTEEAVQRAKQEGRSLWRVSSTLFGHLNTDLVMKPIEELREYHGDGDYPDISVQQFVEEELKAISLLASSQQSFIMSQEVQECVQKKRLVQRKRLNGFQVLASKILGISDSNISSEIKFYKVFEKIKANNQTQKISRRTKVSYVPSSSIFETCKSSIHVQNFSLKKSNSLPKVRNNPIIYKRQQSNMKMQKSYSQPFHGQAFGHGVRIYKRVPKILLQFQK